MAELSDRIRNLSPEKLELLLRQTRSAAPAGGEIPRRPDPGAPAPLSYTQRRLWFHDRLAPGSPLYDMHAAFRVRGRLDPEALAASFNAVVERHEVLRTRFEMLDGEPVQRVVPFQPLGLVREDLGGLAAEAREAELMRRLAAEAQWSFDLARVPLVRTVLFALGEGDWVVSVVLHHIVADGWSIGVLIREMSALYEGRAAGLAPLPLQFADFAAWQREGEGAEELAPHRAFWREQLAGAPFLLELMADRPRPTARTPRGGEARFHLSAEAAARLREEAARHGATLYMLLLAAWGTLLARYSGQTGVLVGSPVAGRGRVETEELIGPFVDTVVRRVDLQGAVRFTDLLARVREAVLAADAHTALPFEKLVEDLQPARSASHTPIFQVWFVLHNTPAAWPALAGAALEAIPLHTGTARFDLTLSVEEAPGGLRGAIEHSADLFDAATARGLADQLTALCAAVAEGGAGQPLADLAWMSAGEAQSALERGRSRHAPEEAEDLAATFRRVVAAAPRAPAVLAGGEELTYGELAERAFRLARHLRSLGAGPESLVGICLPRSLDLLVAVMAVLQSGGAFLVLDPGYPPERLEILLEDAELSVLLTVDEILYTLPAHAAACDIVCLDSDAAVIAGQAGEPPAVALPGRLSRAYVISTSGSTGRPKGVDVPRGPLADHIAGIRREHGLTAADRVLQFAALTFDVALEQIFSALSCGAALVFRGDEIWGARDLSRVLRENGVTVANLPTGLWQQWAAAVAAGEAEGPGEQLRLVVAGGDALSADAARRWHASPLAAVRLLNAYGPTEAVITATLHEVAPLPAEAARVPLGEPLPGRRLFLLDAAGRPVPAGAPGEIHLADPFLARGYLRRPELTAAAFVPDALSERTGGRLYRTGDLGRFHPGGALEFLGRRDHQVKVRGFRIELGEVEAVLAGYRKVREATVAVRGSSPDGKRLVGYVVPVRADEPPSSTELRDHLAGALPEHAVPTAFAVLSELPRRASGKVDRSALPEPEAVGAGQETQPVEPRDETERTVAAIWAEVLSRPRLGIHDNFFDLGGHSLLGTSIIARVAGALGVDLPIQILFTNPTVATFSQRIVEAQREAVEEGAAAEGPIGRAPRGGGLPLAFAHQRLWVFEQLEPGTPAYNVFAVFDLAGDLDAGALEGALTAVVARHEVLRTTFVEGAEGPVQAVSPVAAVDLAAEDLRGLPLAERDAAVQQRAVDAARRPFDLAAGPLLRPLLLRVEDDLHALVLVLHHIVTDGWSLGILVREVAAVYSALATGSSPSLPELPIQYGDFAAWQRRWLEGPRLERLLGYWRRQLDALPVLELPHDRERPPRPSFRGSTLELRIGGAAGAGLRALARAESATPFMVLLAAFQALLHRLSGQDDIAVGTVVANRRRPELEDLAGFFVNPLVLRTPLAGNPTFRELVGRVRDVTSAALAHQDLPFERLVEDLRPERSRDRNPLFQVLFVLQNAAVPEIDLPGLAVRPRQVDAGIAPFDLGIEMVDGADGFSGLFAYSADLFERATAERLLASYQTLLESCAADPGVRILDAPIGETPTTAARQATARDLFGGGSFALDEAE